MSNLEPSPPLTATQQNKDALELKPFQGGHSPSSTRLVAHKTSDSSATDQNPRHDEDEDDDIIVSIGEGDEYKPARSWWDINNIVALFLDSRKYDQEFALHLRHDKASRAILIERERQNRHKSPHTSSQTVTSQTPQVQRQYFLRDPRIDWVTGYFGIETIKQKGDNSPQESLDNAPEDYSALYSPLKPWFDHHKNLNQDEMFSRYARLATQYTANFREAGPGQYALYLKIKQCNNEHTTARLVVRIIVRYTTTYTTDVFFTRFYKRGEDECLDWCYLQAEDQFEVRPHEGVAQINVRIIHDDSYSKEQKGSLFIQCLDLMPARTRHKEPVLLYREKSSISPHSLNVYGKFSRPCITKALKVADQPNNNSLPAHNAPAPDTTGYTDRGTLTRLAASKDGRFLASLTVFSSRLFIQVWKYAPHVDENKGIKSFATSHANGTITWNKIDKGSVDNIDQVSIELAISTTGDKIAVYKVPKTGDWLGDEPRMDVHLYRNPLVDDSLKDKTRLVPFDPPPTLKDVIGFATFVGEFKTGDTVLPSRFVFCDGHQIHVFASDRHELEHMNTIPLNTMRSSLWRTTACELLIRSIATNMFVWVEGKRRWFSTWDLSTGVAIGRFKITDSRYVDSAGITEIQIACNRDTIAIVCDDNSITTIDATTGVLCDRYEFPDRIIDHIVFPSAHSRMLVAMVRGEDDNQQTALVLDALQLEVQEELGFIPSASRLTIISSFGSMKWPEVGLVCQPDVQQIHFYPCEAQVVKSVNIPVGISSDCHFQLKMTIPPFRQGTSKGQTPVKRQVEVWNNTERIFSFIPEPWACETITGRILPTNDRFVICGSWTIQLWSLPTDSETKCRLLYYWSAPMHSLPEMSSIKSDMNIILENYSRFNATDIREFKDGVHRVTVIFPLIENNAKSKKHVMNVPIPNFPMRIHDKRTTLEHCVNSSHLLALTYYELQDELYRDIYSDHAQALINHVNAFINDTVESDDQCASTTSILTYLLKDTCPVEISSKFIEGLLNDGHCPWLPRYDKDFDPLSVAIGQKNDDAVRAILDYCVRKAHASHLGYVMPLEYSFKTLADFYPGILREFFRQASYIPAGYINFQEDYATSSSYEWRIQMRKLFSSISGSKIDPVIFKEYRMPIFTFQLQGHSARASADNIEIKQPRTIELRYDQNIYAVPFPSLCTPSALFSKLSGGDFFNSPLLMAVLSYKWWLYGWRYWKIRISFLLLYYSIFQAMMITQVNRSVEVKSPQDIQGLYFDRFWKVLLLLDLLLGLAFLGFEAIQCVHDKPRRYFTTFFNYIDLSALLFTTICLSQTLITHFAVDRHSGEAPKQLSYIPFANIVVFLHVIVEFRVFQTFGIFVNILFEIIKSIVSFLAIFVIMVIAFDQGMVYLLYTYQTTCSEDGLCSRNSQSKFPSEPIPSFASTLFFLAGRFDIVDEDFDSKRTSFLLLMIMIYIIGFIVLLTLLIGHVTESFAAAKADGAQAWRRQLSETLAEAEMFDKILGMISNKKLGLLRSKQPDAHAIHYTERAIRELFLNARDEHEKFELALKTYKRRRSFEIVSDPYPPTDRSANREVTQPYKDIVELEPLQEGRPLSSTCPTALKASISSATAQSSNHNDDDEDFIVSPSDSDSPVDLSLDIDKIIPLFLNSRRDDQEFALHLRQDSSSRAALIEQERHIRSKTTNTPSQVPARQMLQGK
ncbi:hypothetical protein BGW41_005302 [Actinomortierella wolfii]|nr:hypothetical protein BGW41_005302 [Actinomortierella wolfii]